MTMRIACFCVMPEGARRFHLALIHALDAGAENFCHIRAAVHREHDNTGDEDREAEFTVEKQRADNAGHTIME